MHPHIPRLETEHLLLRPFALADAPAVQALASAPEVAATTLNIPHPYPDGAAEAWIGTHAEAAATGAALTWAIEREADGTLMGAIGLHLNGTHERGELGYWLGVPYWGWGYTTEAARRVTAYAFEVLHLHRVQATCLPRNVASSRVMQKVGMRYEGLMRDYVRKGDVFEDIAMYAVLRTDPGRP
jgi:RimJ/RimL family protein N-acetyltransferase